MSTAAGRRLLKGYLPLAAVVVLFLAVLLFVPRAEPDQETEAPSAPAIVTPAPGAEGEAGWVRAE